MSHSIPNLVDFVRESNRIEDIHRDPTDLECRATADFLATEALTIMGLEKLVSVYKPGAALRVKWGMDVRVGNYLPPAGGAHIARKLGDLLAKAHRITPWDLHVQYEGLHPFMDGNGRSGRALWLWAAIRRGYTGRNLFLRQWYYDSLAQYSPL